MTETRRLVSEERDVLEMFGLDEAQEAVYLTVLDLPSVTCSDLRRRRPDLPPERIDAALDHLEKNGLVAHRTTPHDRYVAVPPDIALLDWLQRRTSALLEAQSTIGTLTKRYQAVSRHEEPAALLEVVLGVSALDRWNQCLAGANREIRVFERPPYSELRPWVAAGTANPIQMDLLAKGVRCRLIYDRAAIDARPNLDELREGIEGGEEARVVGELPLRMTLIDDQLALLPLRHEHPVSEGMLLVRPSPLLTALSALFEAVWQQAPPLIIDCIPGEGGEDPARLDESLVVIAGLLVAGLSDQAVARHLGVSVRTVERRIQRLAAALGAKTRFQAGALAARHGWI
ncbi:helix-turn-helix domain-containing protein [Actinoallomurus oryzae]|uniref:Helix-turn-helix domain-containing protein n=1 Tax=Actinoallomurus oryzae TaxID=502180 RepID=A0ABP8QRY5_9ACTN